MQSSGPLARDVAPGGCAGLGGLAARAQGLVSRRRWRRRMRMRMRGSSAPPNHRSTSSGSSGSSSSGGLLAGPASLGGWLQWGGCGGSGGHGCGVARRKEGTRTRGRNDKRRLGAPTNKQMQRNTSANTTGIRRPSSCEYPPWRPLCSSKAACSWRSGASSRGGSRSPEVVLARAVWENVCVRVSLFLSISISISLSLSLCVCVCVVCTCVRVRLRSGAIGLVEGSG